MEKENRRLFSNLRRELRDEKVLSVMELVPRDLFVPPESRHLAYEDIPLPIGDGQTISQPYIVALMTSALELSGAERVLELGTGSGYQAAILSRLVPRGTVLSIERSPGLARSATVLLRTLGYDNVEVRTAGAALGCAEDAPFDAIVVTAASPRLPPGLLAQMARAGRMVIPIGTMKEQELVRVLGTDEGPTLRLGHAGAVPLRPAHRAGRLAAGTGRTLIRSPLSPFDPGWYT